MPSSVVKCILLVYVFKISCPGFSLLPRRKLSTQSIKILPKQLIHPSGSISGFIFSSANQNTGNRIEFKSFSFCPSLLIGPWSALKYILSPHIYCYMTYMWIIHIDFPGNLQRPWWQTVFSVLLPLYCLVIQMTRPLDYWSGLTWYPSSTARCDATAYRSFINKNVETATCKITEITQLWNVFSNCFHVLKHHRHTLFLLYFVSEIKANLIWLCWKTLSKDVAYYKVLQFKQPHGLEILIISLWIHDPGESHKPTRHILYKVHIDLAQLAQI